MWYLYFEIVRLPVWRAAKMRKTDEKIQIMTLIISTPEGFWDKILYTLRRRILRGPFSKRTIVDQEQGRVGTVRVFYLLVSISIGPVRIPAWVILHFFSPSKQSYLLLDCCNNVTLFAIYFHELFSWHQSINRFAWNFFKSCNEYCFTYIFIF